MLGIVDEKEEDFDIPDNMVLVEAKRPTSLKKDIMVFEVNAGFLDASELSSDSDMEKNGRFFSKERDVLGTWKMKGNVLYLSWAGGKAIVPETVIASHTARRWFNAKTHLSLTVIAPTPDNPWWFTPEVIAEKFQSQSVSDRAFECPVCFLELYRFPQAVIKFQSKRACPHYFHRDCANHLLKNIVGARFRGSACPLCGVPFNDTQPMPDLMRNPREWFSVVDLDLGGSLDTNEVIEALGCCLPLNRHKLTKQVYAHWRIWDPDGDGAISMQEFTAERVGLRDWIINHKGILGADAVKESVAFAKTVPSLDTHPIEWFEYWDRDRNGTLTRDEVLRALIRTFCIDWNGKASLPDAHDLRETGIGLWSGLGYSTFASIGIDEFVKPFGLMDQFLHNQANFAYFGEDEVCAV